jgi:hypothetical protein
VEVPVTRWTRRRSCAFRVDFIKMESREPNEKPYAGPAGMMARDF